ncbi:hypothetical protein GCM10010112_81830 [Actinoplanes lobatus]|uniref:Insertion element IS402-like domain-containing protein n=1 Tax=Actinoplanes lobatus TaxID=113568 RepID=A0ABQ4AUT9_9ACTN|nr:transposase [Actinoplanes lobatus]GGN93516.1 hypothetical protein GCM10010112_81830 [Actinoplanes lobatus]GIE44737.1 hypothetical protein Alo02nite_76350 [Actinoplanes lobatus]
MLGPFLEAWRAKRVSVAGRTGEHDLREIVSAILYQTRAGCQWAYLPHDLPRKSATYYYFALWRDDGTDQTIHDLLRCQTREKAGRREDPTAVAVDTQSIREANQPDASTRRTFGAGGGPRRRTGRKTGTAPRSDLTSSRTSAGTAPCWASTSRSSNAPTPSPVSCRSRNDGSLSRSTAP